MSKEIEYSTQWATILYDDSLIEVIKIKAIQYGLQLVISPIHDKDENEDGSLKKSHRHVLFIFRSKKSRNQMYQLFTEMGCVGCEHVFNKELYYRYLYHDEQFDKAIYNKEDLIFINCGEENFVNETTIFYSIMDLIKDEDITTFTQLYEMVNTYYFKDEKIIKVIRNNFSIFRMYIKENLERKIKESKVDENGTQFRS